MDHFSRQTLRPCLSKSASLIGTHPMECLVLTTCKSGSSSIFQVFNFVQIRNRGYYPVKLIVLIWNRKVSNIMLLFDEYIIRIVPFQIVFLS